MVLTEQADIEFIQKAGQIAGRVLEHLVSLVKPGISTWELDEEAGKSYH